MAASSIWLRELNHFISFDERFFIYSSSAVVRSWNQRSSWACSANSWWKDVLSFVFVVGIIIYLVG